MPQTFGNCAFAKKSRSTGQMGFFLLESTSTVIILTIQYRTHEWYFFNIFVEINTLVLMIYFNIGGFNRLLCF